MKVFICILVSSFILLCSISLYAFWKQENMSLGLSDTMRSSFGVTVWEDYQVSDGVGGWDSYQVNEGTWENYQVKQ
jgi:hypothetical protein